MSASSSPYVSVVMSVYNGEIFIKDSIESILNQSFIFFEFIIINDGSTDGSLDILQKYASLDSRITLVNQKNEGLTKALVKGCHLARGEYIARQDVDDISETTRLERQVKVLEDNPSLVLVGTWYEVHNNHKNLFLKSPLNNDQTLRNILSYQNPFCHSSTMFRKDTYYFVGGYNIRFQTSQDLDLWFRLAAIGKIGMVEEYLVKLNLHDASISSSSKAFEQVKNSVSIRLLNVNKHNLSEIIKLFIATFYHILITLLPFSFGIRLSNIIKHIKSTNK
jgi:glycosyltransferase involved in cell wall biosynthesis